MEPVRLQKLLADAGLCSRRKAEKLILEGRVTVDGDIAQLGVKVDPRKQIILVDNKPISFKRRFVYYILNKPKGYLTTLYDPYGRKTIKELIKDIPYRIYPVGRLDLDSQGLLLLTNHGELTHRLQHPRYKVEKIYHVTVKGIPSKKDIEMLESGKIIINDKPVQPCKVKLLGKKKREATLEIKLKEGRKRQIRLMCKAINHPVIKLIRIAIGPIKLGDLPEGTTRELSKKEIDALLHCVKLTET